MLVVDAGPLIATLDRGDRNHDRCVELLSTHAGPLVVPILTLCEVSHLVSRRAPAQEAAVARAVAAGELLAEPVADADWVRIAELTEHYADLGLGLVDASVVALCERFGETKLATLDHRHFSVVRPSHCDALELLPA